MKRHYPSLLILLLSLTISSCGSSKFSTKNFTPLSDFASLNGAYADSACVKSSTSGYAPYIKKLSHVFGIYDDSIEFVQLKFNKESLCFLYETDSGVQEKAYKGKLKNNYFEVFLKNKLIPIPAFFIWQKERVLIGLNKDNNLLVQYWSDSMGWVLLASGGNTYDYEFVFERISNQITN
ncbi:hypothetical protein LJC39_01050 [Parabacteroides sp. OttesenSCG-928-B22]|nr:hypothetical protein [Parabacteroides sp. OttesenSCG-928-B22]